MNALRIAAICCFFDYLLVLGLGRCAADPATAPATRPALEPIAQLAPGKTEGTIHLVYHGRAKLASPGGCPIVVFAADFTHAEMAPVKVDAAREFTYEADLPPGTYWLHVAPAEKEKAEYWSAALQKFHLDKAGHLYQPREWAAERGLFVMQRRMQGLSPDRLEIAGERPLLKWAAVAGAVRYRGDYRIRSNSAEGWFEVEGTQYQVGSQSLPDREGEWRICAMDAAGNVIASGQAHFIGHGTDAARAAEMRQPRADAAAFTPFSTGKPFLGVTMAAAQVPADSSRPPERLSPGQEPAGSIPGVWVNEVFAGSPAADADLHPGDVITAIDGTEVKEPAETALIIRGKEAGAKVTLTVRRFPQELTLKATIGSSPEGINRSAAEASDTPIDIAGPAWGDVEAGPSVATSFHPRAGAGTFSLTMAQGLPAETVTHLAELPDGGVAFGTPEGVSLWDGANLRTFNRADRFQPRITVGRTVVNAGGNQNLRFELPPRFVPGVVQDLLCDSHGRLWIATAYGVCRIDDKAGQRSRILENRGLSGAYGPRDLTMDVRKIFEAADGKIVLGSSGGAIFLIDPGNDSYRLIRRDDDPAHIVTGIAEDSRRRLWFAIAGVGVVRYDGGKFEQIEAPWIVGKNLAGICIDGGGTVWVADATAGLGALHADGTTEKVTIDRLPGDSVNGISVDRAGRLWVISDGGLAVRAPGDAAQKEKAWRFVAPADAPGAACLLNMKDGMWWIGGAGAWRQAQLTLEAVNPRTTAVARLEREVETDYPDVRISRTLARARRVVVGVADRRILRYDGNAWEDLSEKLGRVDVAQIFADSQKTIWIATRGNGLIGLSAAGIRRFNNDPGHARGIIYSVDEAPDGTLFAGTQFGLWRLAGEKWEQIDSRNEMGAVGQVLADRRGRIWMIDLTDHSLFAFNRGAFLQVMGPVLFNRFNDAAVISNWAVVGSLRMDHAGNVLADFRASSGNNARQHTLRWDGTLENIGEPEEVK